ncbi:AAA domain-containing protein [uncultured Acidaminococcus sp.]|jgi:superfamily I DNA and/or RNA helicase/very-short-patch-repair endonuclease|uniref:AAA domain-containing protein n=1 Tax=uncultured Acidaminococcus sp. TaxID=352152 RepID=UPI00265E6564|nr:AAA domain-containing protein [uncultured Acidaminococcus sp.]
MKNQADNNRELLKNFFTGIGKIINLQEKVITDFHQYDKVIEFEKYLASDSQQEYITFNANPENGPILTVKRPSFTSAPAIPASLQEWIIADKWKDFLQTPEVRKSIQRGQEMEAFEADPSRVRQWEKLLPEREAWAEEGKRLNQIEKLFQTLYQLNTMQKQDFDSKELVFAFGLFETRAGNPIHICHPLFTKRLRISDAKSEENILEVFDAGENLEVETSFFQEIQDGSVHQIAQIGTTFLKHEETINIYEEPTLEIALKDVLSKITSQGEYCTKEQLPGARIKSRRQYLLSYSPLILYRSQKSGIAAFLNKIVEDVDKNGKIKPHLIDIMNPQNTGSDDASVPADGESSQDIGKRLNAISGEDEEILMTKPANREQLFIAQEIAHKNAVEVQGPPGTGKTHTIANLLGNLLAQGKSVLVTSEKVKALTVLRDKLDERLQPLCIPFLGDNQSEMMDSIQKIQNGISRIRPADLQKEIQELQEQRKSLIQELEDRRKRIFLLRNQQSKEIVYQGEEYSLLELGKKLAKEDEEVFHFPEPLKRTEVFPITEEDYQVLLQNQSDITLEEERELQVDLPEAEDFISPEAMKDLLEKDAEIVQAMETVSADPEMAVQCDWEQKRFTNHGLLLAEQPKPEKIEEVLNLIETMPSLEKWQYGIIENVRLGEGYAARWKRLQDKVQQYGEKHEKYDSLSSGKKVQIEGPADDTLLKYLDEVAGELQQNGSLGFMFRRVTHRDACKALDRIRINGNAVHGQDDVELAKETISLQKDFEELKNLWNDNFQGSDVSVLDQQEAYSPFLGKTIVQQIQEALTWKENWLEHIFSQLSEAGFNSDTVKTKIDQTEKAESVVGYLEKKVTDTLNLVQLMMKKHEVEQVYAKNEQMLRQFEFLQSENLGAMLTAMEAKDGPGYESAYAHYQALLAKRAFYKKTAAVYQKVKEAAPNWARNLSNRTFKAEDYSYEKLLQSWKWSQLNQRMKEVFSGSLEDYEKTVSRDSVELRDKTAELASKEAWLHLYHKINGNQKITSALNAWASLVKKIGKGHSKYAEDYRKQAMDNMKIGQTGVPVWIMTVNKALQTLDPQSNHFDVVIIDEASQSALEAIPVSYLGDKVIVVGDDKQVSPLQIGNDLTKVNELLQMYIAPYTRYPALFDNRTSYYEIVKTVFTPILLREHFRCVPEIIGYCNKYFYNNEIKPLRDSHNSNLLPPIVNYRVDGKREGKQKINKEEARTIVSLLLACFEQKEYADKTFGVISMLGAEQADYIRELLVQRIDKFDDLKKREFFSGIAQNFQGDERDVIFLSLVDDPSSVRTVTKDDARKRYNVAVSRAKDQLWVVHSLNQEKLSKDDLKYQLLDYASHYPAYMEEQMQIEEKADSPFEVDVAHYLRQKGYHFIQQYQVGAYRLDFAVIYQKKMVALECDGERYHSSESAIASDMERQTVLQRLGWKFIRIRGGIFYRNKELAMEKVFEQLEELGIKPEKNKQNVVTAAETDLLKRVKQRAAEIRDQWENGSQKLEKAAAKPETSKKSPLADKGKTGKGKRGKTPKIIETELFASLNGVEDPDGENITGKNHYVQEKTDIGYTTHRANSSPKKERVEMPAPGEKENDGADDIFSKFSIEDVEDMLNR